MRKLLALCLLAALASPAAASAAVRDVSMRFNRLTPTFRIALVGDTVRWTNAEPTFVVHNVVSSQFGSSGDLGPGATWTRDFAAPGSYPYVCTHHPATMRGTVVVDDLYMTGPTTVVRHGAAARFSGLAPAGPVTLLRNGTPVASTTAAGDGAFAISVPAARPGTYQATSGAAQSSAVRVRVRPRLGIGARRAGRSLAVTVAARPSQAGARLVVERLNRSRWVRVARGRLNASSRATFRIGRKPMKLRARTTRAVGGYERATSRTIRVR